MVAGNHLGVDITGTIAFGNGDGSVTDAGVRVNGGMGSTIGGTTAADRNIISGNNQTGIFLTSSARGNRIIGNYIGTDATGTVAIPNLGEGMRLDASPTNNTVGGPTPGERNIISGNTTVGITIRGDDNLVQGNFIGTDVTGTVALPNLVNGIDLMERTSDNNTIGGTNTSPGVLDVGNLISGQYRRRHPGHRHVKLRPGELHRDRRHRHGRRPQPHRHLDRGRPGRLHQLGRIQHHRRREHDSRSA